MQAQYGKEVLGAVRLPEARNHKEEADSLRQSPRLIEIGMDVIHPIQKFAMDQIAAADQFAGKFTAWIGFDVQQTIPYGTPEEVFKEARALIDTWRRPNGRLIFAAGNGINGDCSLESLRALYEAVFYGVKE